MAIVKRIKGWLVPGVVAMCLLIGCASRTEPFVYEPSNELKPGPGIFTGEEGAFTIYGRPLADPDEPGLPGEESWVEPDDPAAP